MGRSDINLGIIIQARMGSRRLPGKILRPIHDRVLLEHILNRLKNLRRDATIVIATGNSTQDDVVESFCRNRGVHCFRGSEHNVQERFYLCARDYGFNQIVRLTGDNPFIDVDELNRLIELHIEGGSDFSHSFNSLPVGVGAEIFTFNALEDCHREGKEPHHLEHVDEFLLENPSRFRTLELDVDLSKRRPDIRLTVDTEEDYSSACYISRNAVGPEVSTEEAIALALKIEASRCEVRR